MYIIKEIKRTELKGDYIKATHIGVIVKHYTKQNFKTFDSIELVASRIKWNAEERKRYEDAIDTIEDQKKLKNPNYITRQERFAMGRQFEKDCEKPIKEKYVFDDVECFNWNDRGTVLYDDELKLVAVPDYIIKDKFDGNKVIECKGSKSTTPSYENYCYQLVLQDLLLTDYFNTDEVARCILKFKDKEIELKEEDIHAKQSQIGMAIEEFWQDYYADKFKLMTVDEAIKKLHKDNEKISYIETREELLEKINIIQNYENQVEHIAKLKEELYEAWKDFDSVSDGENNISVVKPTSTLITKDYYQKELVKAEESYNKKIASIKKQIDSHKEDQEKITRKGYLRFN